LYYFIFYKLFVNMTIINDGVVVIELKRFLILQKKSVIVPFKYLN